MAARYPDGVEGLEAESNSQVDGATVGLSDKEILNIAESISDEMNIRRLGIELGFKWAKVDQFLKTNRSGGDVTSKGTQNMLSSWRNNTRAAEQRTKMRKALVEAELTAVAEKYLLLDPEPSSAMTAQEVKQCQQDLIQYYLEDACKIKTSPLDPDNYVELDQIFINLMMEKKQNQPGTATKEPVAYDDIMRLPSKRVMIVGEAGVGKTTICAKMAHDWARGQHFKNIKLLLFILLCEVTDQKTLGEIVKDRLSDSNDVKEKQIDEYARTNPEKVLILMDGLDEFNGKAKIITEILEATKLKSCQVIVTARPCEVEKISTKDRLSKIYTRIHVEGFSKAQIQNYVRKFFDKNDPKAGESLLHFIQEKGGVISETIASYPIYCTLLCHLWNDEKRRDAIRKFQTFFQIFDEMVYQLKEHHSSKTIGDGEDLDFTKVDACFEVLGKIAFTGLVDKQMIFDKGSFKTGDLTLAYEVGILSTKGKRLAPRAMRRKTGKRFVEEVFFPHKLLQEFMASIHLSSCHKESPDKFKKMLKKNMLDNYMEFRYVFYFTAAQGSEIGRDTLKLLRRGRVHEDFIVDTAFECQDKEMTQPFIEKLLVRDPAVQLTDYMKPHTVTAYLYAMDTFDDLGKLTYKKTRLSKTASHQAAETTFKATNIHELNLSEANFQEDFYVVMADMSASSQIQKITHRDSKLSKDDSLRYAIGLCKMPCLTELELISVYVYPSFYGPFADPESKCQIKKMSLSRQAFNKATFRALVKTPSLTSLKLDRLMVLSREDAGESATKAAKGTSHVTELEIDDKTLLASGALGLQESCSRVTKIILHCSGHELTKDVIKCLEFPLLTNLHLEGSTTEDTILEESTSICGSLMERWPALTSLIVSKILIDDAQAENILKTVKRHRSLKKLKFHKCFDDDEFIDELCADIRKKGIIELDIENINDDEMLDYDEEEYEYSRRESFDLEGFEDFEDSEESEESHDRDHEDFEDSEESHDRDHEDFEDSEESHDRAFNRYEENYDAIEERNDDDVDSGIESMMTTSFR
ncbi:uncharacterized protein LOC121429006 [Lytechinus variegatus]|uniref:uncharacterized protein LOC121429006 n=1 Tax=Lytechinus variegatus TaxID=7654 RepID=UPI001BB26FE9|nr:uncharacterized protein LOC121429006 [Lytechinus variegatus]